MGQDPTVNCPAAEIVHPVLSHNDHDAQCNVSGRIQPAQGSPCCGDYAGCAIWRRVKEIEWETKRALRPEFRGAPVQTLEGVERDRVRVG